MPRNEWSSSLVEDACINLITSTFYGSGFTPNKLQEFDFTLYLCDTYGNSGIQDWYHYMAEY